MLALPLTLLQQQPGFSWTVWGLAIFAFLIATALVVYTFRKMRRGEKEAEGEDWTLSSKSLFGEAHATATETHAGQPGGPAVIEQVNEVAADYQTTEGKEEIDEISDIPAISSEDDFRAGITEGTAVEPVPPESGQQPDQGWGIQPMAPSVPTVEEGTRVLGSQPPGAIAQPEEPEPTPFGEEIWTELEQQSPVERSGSMSDSMAGPSEPDNRPPPPHTTFDSTAPPDPGAVDEASAARVDYSRTREKFEPPRIQRIDSDEPLEARGNDHVNVREPFEAPRIEPIRPRAETSQTGPPTLRITKGDQVDLTGRERPDETPDLESGLGLSASLAPPSSAVRSGSILGLPASGAVGPLVFGEPTRKSDDGILSLSNYGKDTDTEGGHGGTIALLITILVVAGAVISYLYVPSVKSRVDSLVDRVRNRDRSTVSQPAPERPRAMVFPGRNEAVAGVMKARGAVDNVSDPPETLSGLSVEVALERMDGSGPETRNVPVTPDQLLPRQRGIYEFDYDARRFMGYRVTGLSSNGVPLKFSTPGQNR